MNEPLNNKDLQSIIYSLNVLRIKNDIKYHEEEIERTKQKTVAGSDPFFHKLGKGISNAANKAVYENNTKLLKEKEQHLINVYAKSKEDSIEIIEDKVELTAQMNKLLLGEIVEMRTVYIGFALFFTNPYIGTELKETMRKESFIEIAKLLSLPDKTFVDYEKSLLEKYRTISGKDPLELLNEAVKTGGDVFVISLIALGVLSAVTGGIVGAAVGGVLVASLILGLLAGQVKYANSDTLNKKAIEEAFKKMTPEEVDFLLLQKLAIIEALNPHRDNEEVDQIIKSMVDELINIKSDLDLALFAFRDNEENINGKKKESLLRFDKLLLKVVNS